MKTTEIRVRPVVRHIVTRYTEGDMPGKPGEGLVRFSGCETLGEFDSEAQAEQVAEAMRSAHWPKKYVLVQVTFEPETKAFYADTQEESERLCAKLAEETGCDWRIFSRNA